jgi:hypothetical protein
MLRRRKIVGLVLANGDDFEASPIFGPKSEHEVTFKKNHIFVPYSPFLVKLSMFSVSQVYFGGFRRKLEQSKCFVAAGSTF